MKGLVMKKNSSKDLYRAAESILNADVFDPAQIAGLVQQPVNPPPSLFAKRQEPVRFDEPVAQLQSA
jgi:hypothetical protein